MRSLGALHLIGPALGPYGLLRKHGHKLEPFFKVWFEEPETRHLPYDFLRINDGIVGYTQVPALSKAAKLWTSDLMTKVVDRVNAAMKTIEAGANGTTRIMQRDWQYITDLIAEMERMEVKKASGDDDDSMSQMLKDARAAIRPLITISRVCYDMQAQSDSNYTLDIGVHAYFWQNDEMHIEGDVVRLKCILPVSTIDGLIGRDVALLVPHPAIPAGCYRILSAVQSGDLLELHTDMHDEKHLLQCELIDG